VETGVKANITATTETNQNKPFFISTFRFSCCYRLINKRITHATSLQPKQITPVEIM
jgi:hypothetical protein